jgi:hypothetical protein
MQSPHPPNSKICIMKSHSKSRIILIIVLGLFSLSLTFCSKKNEEGNNVPEVVSCDHVKYKGFTYYIGGCSGTGVASFDVTTTQNGNSASFHIVCSGGCIRSAILK